MTQTTTHPKGGWQQQEIDLLFEQVRQAAQNGRPLRDVFAKVGGELNRRPNSIRNFYYARVREEPELCARRTPFRSFTPEEVHDLLRQVLQGRGEGLSVRAVVTRMAQGDRAGMLRYQNKYRSILKNHPEMLMEVAQELRAEGLPCPENAAACRRYERSTPSAALEELRTQMADPAVCGVVDALCECLRRREMPEGMVSRQRFEEVRREADRLKVEVDLLKMALEDVRGNEPVVFP